MIGQCLSNKNESVTVLKTKKFLERPTLLVPTCHNLVQYDVIHLSFSYCYCWRVSLILSTTQPWEYVRKRQLVVFLSN